MSGVIPSESAWDRISRAVRRDEARYADATKEGRRRELPGGGCRARNEVWQIVLFGTPTGGTFDIDLKVGGTTDTLTFGFDDSASDVETELETHTNIASGDVTVTGGDLPGAAITVEFTGDLANMKFDTPEFDFSSLTGGSGVGMVIVIYHGHAKDGSAA